MGGQRNISLLITPLAVYDTNHLNHLDFIARRNKLHRVPLIRLQHWAIEIGHDYVYEVTSRDSEDGMPIFRQISWSEWWDERKEQNAKVQSRLIGVTTHPDTALYTRADSIWNVLFAQEYHLVRTNCQVFATIFWATIRTPQVDLTPEKQAQLQSLPAALNPFAFVESKARQVKRLAKKSTAFSWFGSWFGSDGGNNGARHNARQETPEQARQRIDSVPRNPNKGWLDALHEEAREGEIEHQSDFHEMVRRVNMSS